MIPPEQAKVMGNKVLIYTSTALIFLGAGCAGNKGQTPGTVSPRVEKISPSESLKPVRKQSRPGFDVKSGSSFDVKSASGPDAKSEPGSDVKPEPGYGGKADNNYVIGPEDVIEVSVWKNTDLSKVVKVRPDGQISLPLIGDVNASGLTPTALKDAIANKLKEYKETPLVSVIVVEINSYNIFVMGEVVHPGKYSLKSNTTLLQALSLAGGFTPYASRNKILLMRKDPATFAVSEIRVKYDKILSGNDPQRDILLKPGDTIVVP
jgi:polysaccharide biosynthesis/export protein